MLASPQIQAPTAARRAHFRGSFGGPVDERNFAGSGIWPGVSRHGAGRRVIPVERIAATAGIVDSASIP
jgi:hypothetical protein